MGERGGTRSRAPEERGLSTADAFQATFGERADGVWCAPGRVNLIGEHTDYNEGFVLPFAVDLICRVAGRRREDGRVRLFSRQLGSGGELALGDRRTEGLAPWAHYVAGVAWALQEQGAAVSGADLLVDSQVPAGAGLSSSAALECSAGLALCELAGHTPDPVALALAGQQAEAETVGAPVGVMDQMASALGSEEGLLLIDCRTLEHRFVPQDWEDQGLTVLVIDTRVAHAHAGGGYATRRAECEQAAALLGVRSLRDVTPEKLEASSLDGVLLRRARHVVTENERVLATVAALASGRVELLGALLAEGHRSLRDDFEVSCPELDMAVESAVLGGAVGARMTGGGFGGSVLALVPAPLVETVERACTEAAVAAGAPIPVVRAVKPVTGAGRCG